MLQYQMQSNPIAPMPSMPCLSHYPRGSEASFLRQRVVCVAHIEMTNPSTGLFHCSSSLVNTPVCTNTWNHCDTAVAAVIDRCAVERRSLSSLMIQVQSRKGEHVLTSKRDS